MSVSLIGKHYQSCFLSSQCDKLSHRFPQIDEIGYEKQPLESHFPDSRIQIHKSWIQISETAQVRQNE